MRLESENFLNQADNALADVRRTLARDKLGVHSPNKRSAAVESFGDFDSLREHVHAVRQHSLDHLDHYLMRFEEEALANGNSVHFARDGDEMNDIVLDICRSANARKVAKGKSMVSEETALNEHLQKAGLEVIETDLGEYIIQIAGEKPSHITGPALHKPEDEIRELFLDQHPLGDRDLDTPAELVSEARSVLREHFLSADVGIIGSNALVAENGYSMLVTNEGNGDLCANLPKVLVICTTIERVLPSARDAMAVLRLLARSTTGQAISCYSSFYSGPAREDDIDGPLETHIVLLDNRRSEVLASDYQEILQCIRCGACLNHCPVYISAGGHAYGSVYPGPMGSVLTPLLTSLEESNILPNACTSCGRCEEVCPANIGLPDLLRDLRHEENTTKVSDPRWRRGIKWHAWLSRQPWLYHFFSSLGIRLLNRLGRKSGYLSRLPFASGWTSERELPVPQKNTFMRQYKAEKGRKDD
jgi:L-lactate dehydrogenase complex protein LldF